MTIADERGACNVRPMRRDRKRDGEIHRDVAVAYLASTKDREEFIKLHAASLEFVMRLGSVRAGRRQSAHVDMAYDGAHGTCEASRGCAQRMVVA